MAPYWNERRVDCLRRLAQQGCTIEEIGEVFRDATAQRIMSKLTRMRLKVADTRKLTIPLSASEERALSAAARARGLDPDGLGARILHLVITDDLIGAVLDDGVAA
jgi:hypothetical protein